MSWEAAGAIGEIAGAIGVILTLAYLARQMRLNSLALKNETTRDGIQMVIDSYSTVIADEDVASIYLRGMEDFDSLNEVEQIRFHYVCVQRLQAASANMSFYDTGDVTQMDQIETSLKPWVGRMVERRGFRQWWDSRGRTTIEPEFARFVEALRRRVNDPEPGETVLRESRSSSGESP